MREINLAGVQLAREAAGKRAFVAGSVGPTGLTLETLSPDALPDVAAAFREQCEALVEAGVDAILLETFRQPDELELALEAARAASAGKRAGDRLRVVRRGRHHGRRPAPEQVAELLAELAGRRDRRQLRRRPGRRLRDGDAHEGARACRWSRCPTPACRSGRRPLRVHGHARVLPALRAPPVQGRRQGGRRLLRHDARAHPQDRRGRAHGRAAASRASTRPAAACATTALGATSRSRPASRSWPRATRARSAQKLGKQFVVSVEVNPPPGLSLETALDGARALKRGGVDVINVADGPRAQARMGNLALCLRIQQEVGHAGADARDHARSQPARVWSRTCWRRTSSACATWW